MAMTMAEYLKTQRESKRQHDSRLAKVQQDLNAAKHARFDTNPWER